MEFWLPLFSEFDPEFWVVTQLLVCIIGLLVVLTGELVALMSPLVAKLVKPLPDSGVEVEGSDGPD